MPSGRLPPHFDPIEILHEIRTECVGMPFAQFGVNAGCFRGKYPEKRLQNSFEAVLQGPEVGAVVIATPAKTHFELAKRGLPGGKQVLVEKPFALVVGEAEELHWYCQI